MASNRPGIVFGSSSASNGDALVAQLSALPKDIEDNARAIILQFLEEAVQEMAKDVKTKGVRGGVPNNDGRLKSRAMLRSIGYTIKANRRGRIAVTFGYIHNAPQWALWQEYGTDGGQGNGRGILELLALTNAYNRFVVKLENAFSNGSVINFEKPGLVSGYRGGRGGINGLAD